MESELDLNDIIQEMHVIATMPDLYHLLVELNAVHSLLGLLSHENTDILSLLDDFRLSDQIDPFIMFIKWNVTLDLLPVQPRLDIYILFPYAIEFPKIVKNTPGKQFKRTLVIFK